MNATITTSPANDPADTAVSEQTTASPSTQRVFRPRDWHPWLLGLLVLGSLLLRVAWLDKPAGSLIFDEAYYVNAARVILGTASTDQAHYADAPRGLDPNKEHPPLAKLLIVGAMQLFGDNAWGWRLASVLCGTGSIPLVYGIARRCGAAAAPTLLATFCYAFDNLVFVHSRIATLDIFVVTFLLLGIYCFLSDWPVLAGFALTLATLCKISGLYGLAALVLFVGARLVRGHLATGRWDWAPCLPLLLLTGVYAITFIALLGLLDLRWGQIKNPFEHVAHIFRYGFALTRANGPQGQESAPWQWLLNEVQMTYLRVDSQVIVNGATKETRPLIYFRGAMNPFIVFAVPFAIAHTAQSAWRRRDDLSFMVLALFITTYLPYWPAALLAQRISYIFYFLPTIPAVTLGIASFLYSRGVPRVVRWAFIGAVLLGFFGYFPFRHAP